MVVCGGSSEAEPSCDVLSLRYPDNFNRWLADTWSDIVAKNAEPTARVIEASFTSAVPEEVARDLLRVARPDRSDVNSQNTIRRS